MAGATVSESVTSDRNFRLVDRYTVHEGCAPLVERVARIVPAEAHYIVLDLDRTVHLGLTIGECLGWEILSDPTASTAVTEGDGYLSGRHPLRTLRRLGTGVRNWGLPGLVYAATVRLGDRWEIWHRTLVAHFGADYVERVQSSLRIALMTSASGFTHAQLQSFAERAWQRWQRRLVITREVIAEARRHCPQLRGVVLSSASTEPTVAQAAGELGVDGFVSSGVDVVERTGDRGVREGDVYTGPAGRPRWVRMRRPEMFSRPGAVVHNAAENKVRLLRMRYPEVFAAESVSVAISDNNYGEDRCWADHFDHVVALNSRHPFSPFVDRCSPCRSMQAVDALPVRDDGSEHKRWLGTLVGGDYDAVRLREQIGAELRSKLEGFIDALEQMRAAGVDAYQAPMRRRLALLAARISDAIAHYNASTDAAKTTAAREIARLERSARRIRVQLARASAPSARLECEIQLLHAAAGRLVAARR
jgi:hypothetical protein